MSITAERTLSEAIRVVASQHELPPHAPLAVAEQLATAALAEGASGAEALHRAEAYLRSWSMHPANVLLGNQLRAAG